MAAGTKPTKPTPWVLSHAEEERERSITALPYLDTQGQAAERDERWHAARLVRRRYRWPHSWLECFGLIDVPPDPDGWCTCRRDAGGRHAGGAA
jgi:hypothetical protein